MADPRQPCLTPGCPNTIQPATARRTGGYCGPCAGRRAKADHDEYVRTHRREVDRYAGVTDPVEMLRLIHWAPQPGPLLKLVPPPKALEELYTSLDAGQVGAMMALATDAVRADDKHHAEDIARCLAAFTDADLTPLLRALINQGRAWPEIAFRNAGAEIRDLLISGLTAGTLGPDHALRALAWIGDERVCAFYRDADLAPPAWTSGLYIPPSRYAHQAGWELTPAGDRRDLCSATCFAVRPATPGEPPDPAVRLFGSAPAACPFCGRGLVHVLHVGPDAQPLGLPAVTVLACDVCACYAADAFYAGPGPDRVPAPHPANQPPSVTPPSPRDWPPNPWTDIPVHLTHRRPYHAADQFLPTTFAQIGGLPTWVQDTAYPRCPDCQRTMTFVAQVDNAQFPYQEGTYYCFLCPDCRNTATCYQQT